MLMLRSQFISELFASCFPFAFGGGLDLGDIGVYRSSFRSLPLPVLLFPLAGNKLGHNGEIFVSFRTKKLNS